MPTLRARTFSLFGLLALVATAVMPVAPALAAETSSDSMQRWTGTLTAMSGTTLPATLTLQVDAAIYTVNVTADTKLVRLFYGPSSLDEIGVGDRLKILGTLSGTTITAKHIRNLSIQRRGGVFVGSVESINTSAQTFVLDPVGRPDQTVSVASTTKIFLGHQAGTFGDLAVGQKVRVVGLWRRTSSIIAADRVHVKLAELEGTVSAIDCAANTMTIDRKRDGQDWNITLTATTSFVGKHRKPIACADVLVDHKVHIRGLKTGTTSLTAMTVVDQNKKASSKIIVGTVGDDIDVTNQRFEVEIKKGTDYVAFLNADSLLVNKEGVRIAFSELQTGDKVHILGSSATLDTTGTAFAGMTPLLVHLLIDKDLPE